MHQHSSSPASRYVRSPRTRAINEKGQIGTTRKGWIENDLFMSMLNMWIASLPKPQDLTMLLLMDGHSAPYQIEVARLSMANKIEIILFLPHTSRILQPLDAMVFGVFKVKIA
jgi:hypothetical protein